MSIEIIDCSPVGENDAIVHFSDALDVIVEFTDAYVITGMHAPDNARTIDRERAEIVRAFVAQCAEDMGYT